MPFLLVDHAIIAGIKDHGACPMACFAYLNSRCRGDSYTDAVGCYASYHWMEVYTHYSRRQCIRAIAYLIDIGWIDQQHRPGEKAPWYTILHRTNRMIQPRRGDTHVTSAAAGVTPVTSRGDTHVTSTGDTHDTQRRAEDSRREELFLHRPSGPDPKGRAKGSNSTVSPGRLSHRQQMIERARLVEAERHPPEEAHIVVPPPGTWIAEHRQFDGRPPVTEGDGEGADE